MLNILLIGSSKVIKKFINEKFKTDNIKYLSFRESWTENIRSTNDVIIVSGFHYSITSMKFEKLEKYINDYFEYLKRMSLNCKQIYFISTDLNLKISFSRVVYFYFFLFKKINDQKLNIKVLSFNSLLDLNENKIKILIYKILKKKFHIDYLKDTSFEKLLIKKIHDIKFKFILLPRSRNIDRLLRIFEK